MRAVLKQKQKNKEGRYGWVQRTFTLKVEKRVLSAEAGGGGAAGGRTRNCSRRQPSPAPGARPWGLGTGHLVIGSMWTAGGERGRSIAVGARAERGYWLHGRAAIAAVTPPPRARSHGHVHRRPESAIHGSGEYCRRFFVVEVHHSTLQPRLTNTRALQTAVLLCAPLSCFLPPVA